MSAAFIFAERRVRKGAWDPNNTRSAGTLTRSEGVHEADALPGTCFGEQLDDVATTGRCIDSVEAIMMPVTTHLDAYDSRITL